MKKEVATLVLLFQTKKSVLDRSDGVLLLPSENTEALAKEMNKIGPETVLNDQFLLAVMETGCFSSR